MSVRSLALAVLAGWLFASFVPWHQGEVPSRHKGLITGDGADPEAGLPAGGCLPVAVADRFHPSNPAVYVATPLVIGRTQSAFVDTVPSGHLQAFLLAFDAPISIPLGGGQQLLCLGGSELFTGSGLGPVAGPWAEFPIAVPNDLGLCGTELYSQALLFGGTVPFALSNAQDLVVTT